MVYPPFIDLGMANSNNEREPLIGFSLYFSLTSRINSTNEEKRKSLLASTYKKSLETRIAKAYLNSGKCLCLLYSWIFLPRFLVFFWLNVFSYYLLEIILRIYFVCRLCFLDPSYLHVVMICLVNYLILILLCLWYFLIQKCILDPSVVSPYCWCNYSTSKCFVCAQSFSYLYSPLIRINSTTNFHSSDYYLKHCLIQLLPPQSHPIQSYSPFLALMSAKPTESSYANILKINHSSSSPNATQQGSNEYECGSNYHNNGQTTSPKPAEIEPISVGIVSPDHATPPSFDAPPPHHAPQVPSPSVPTIDLPAPALEADQVALLSATCLLGKTWGEDLPKQAVMSRLRRDWGSIHGSLRGKLSLSILPPLPRNLSLSLSWRMMMTWTKTFSICVATLLTMMSLCQMMSCSMNSRLLLTLLLNLLSFRLLLNSPRGGREMMVLSLPPSPLLNELVLAMLFLLSYPPFGYFLAHDQLSHLLVVSQMDLHVSLSLCPLSSFYVC
ncbi:uncharacterized protein [Spinacia oleracea]|uniref:Uncharacterized protein n=1 Tax=Spinacia oleracea TaxID=3562 RepID=A0A9R0JND0_SPIOL|nr:uncharacterized protein LOC110780557 [Spinacia oleracea]